MHHKKGWFMVILASIFYCYQFIVRVFPNVLHDEIMHTLSTDVQGLGWVISMYGTAYALMQIPLGFILDRFGPRLFISLSCLLCALGTILFSYTHNMNVAALARFIMGMGSACGFISCVKIAILWLPSHLLARSIAITMIFGTLGASVGGGPICHLKSHIGYQPALIFIGFLGIILSFLLLKFIRNIHADDPQKISRKDYAAYSHESPLEDIKIVIKNRQSWYIAIFSMIMYAPITALGEAWGVPYIHHLCNVSNIVAATVITLMFVGAAVGSPVFTAISDYMRLRRLPMILGCLMSLFFCAWLLMLKNPTLNLVKFIFFMIGFSYTAKVLTFSSICEIMPKRISGISIAFINTIVMSTGAIFHPLIGSLTQFMAQAGLSHTEKTPYIQYNLADYQFGLVVLPMSLILGLITIFFIRETHPERSKTKN